jgi:signal peptidase I
MQGAPRRPPEVIRSLDITLALWDELRATPGPHLFVMRGMSMWPSAPDGSVLAVRPCSSRDLAPGQMVTFRRAGMIVTHRVIHVDREGTVLAWGDAVLTPDARIGPADVLGAASLVGRGALGGPAAVRTVVRRLGAGIARAVARVTCSLAE